MERREGLEFRLSSCDCDKCETAAHQQKAMERKETVLKVQFKLWIQQYPKPHFPTLNISDYVADTFPFLEAELGFLSLVTHG